MEGPLGEYIPGILDNNELDEGIEKTYKLLDIQTNDRKLLLSSNRQIDVKDLKFSEFITEITIPEHDLSEYNSNSETWKKSKLVELNVNNDDTIIYTKIS